MSFSPSAPNFAHDLGDAEKGGGEKDHKTRRRHQIPKIERNESNLAENQNGKRDQATPYARYAAPDARIWGLYLEEAEAEDRELMEPWNKDLDSLLVFAGLFAAILTAFLIESRKDLYEDPQTQLLKEILGTLRNVPETSTPQAFAAEASSLNINCLWFTSLTLTLSSALGGVLSKGWIAKYSNSSTRKTSNDACARHLRANRVRQWRLGVIISIISLLIQIALFLFFAGLVIILWDVQGRIKFTILTLVSIVAFIYMIITFLPWVFPACPLQTPITDGTPWIRRQIIYGVRGGMGDHSPKDGDSSLKKRAISLYRELRSIPEPQELQSQILAWVISNTLDERVLKEALRALAGIDWTQSLLDALIESGAWGILNLKLPNYLAHARAQRKDEEWTSVILFLMLQLELYSASKVGSSPFEFLLDEGGPLYKWEEFEPVDQPLAFSLRLYIFLNHNMDDPDTTWSGSIHGLIETVHNRRSSMRDLLLDAVFRGTEADKPNIRRMCGVIMTDLLLAADIQSLSNRLEIVGLSKATSIPTFRQVPSLLCKLCLDDDPEVRERATQGLIRMAEDGQLCIGFEDAFGELVAIQSADKIPAILTTVVAASKESTLRVYMNKGVANIMKILASGDDERRIGAINIAVALSQYEDLQPRLKKVIAYCTGLLTRRESNIRNAASWALKSFAMDSQFRLEVRSTIIESTKLLNHNDGDIRCIAVEVFKDFGMQAELRPDIKAAIPGIANSIEHSRKRGLTVVIEALSKFSSQTEFQPDIKSIIPLMPDLLIRCDQSIQVAILEMIQRFAMNAEFLPEIEASISPIAKVLVSHPHDIGISIIETFKALAMQVKLQSGIRIILPVIVDLFDGGNTRMQVAVVEAIMSFSTHALLQPQVKPLIPRLVTFLGPNQGWELREAAAEAIKALSMKAEFIRDVEKALPGIVELLGHWIQPIREGAARLIGDLVVQAELQTRITTLTPNIVKLLKNDSEGIRIGAIGVVKSIVVHTELQPEVKLAFSQVTDLLEDPSNYVRGAAIQTVISLVTRTGLEPELKAAVPKILRLLSDEWYGIKGFGVDAVSAFAIRAELRSEVNFAIPMIIKLLRDNWEIKTHVLPAIESFSTQGMFQAEVKPAILEIMDLLFTNSGVVYNAAIKTLRSISMQAEFLSEMDLVIRKLIEALNDDSGEIKKAAIGAIASLLEPSELVSKVKLAIPRIVELLGDDWRSVTDSAQKAIKSFSTRMELQPEIGAAIPKIVELITNAEYYISYSALEIMKAIGLQTGLQTEIRKVVPELIKLLSHPSESIRRELLDVIESFTVQTGLLSEIKIMIPSVAVLLEDNSDYLQISAIRVLTNLAAKVELRPEIKIATLKIAELLRDSPASLQKEAVMALAELAKKAEFHSELKTIFPKLTDLLIHKESQIRVLILQIITTIATETDLHAEFDALMPILIRWLNDHDSNSQEAATYALLNLVSIAEFRARIQRGIDSILSWLTLRNYKLRIAALDAIRTLTDYDELRDHIRGHSMHIVGLLGDQYPPVRAACVRLVCSPGGYATLGPRIPDIPPRVTNLLVDVDIEVRTATANALICFTADVQWRPIIKPRFLRYQFFLEERERKLLQESLQGVDAENENEPASA